MPKKAKSKKQARFFGAIAGGKMKKKGLSKKKAKEMLKGTKMSKLPLIGRKVEKEIKDELEKKKKKNKGKK